MIHHLPDPHGHRVSHRFHPRLWYASQDVKAEREITVTCKLIMNQLARIILKNVAAKSLSRPMPFPICSILPSLNKFLHVDITAQPSLIQKWGFLNEVSRVDVSMIDSIKSALI
jgi:hypothetical protein